MSVQGCMCHQPGANLGISGCFCSNNQLHSRLCDTCHLANVNSSPRVPSGLAGSSVLQVHREVKGGNSRHRWGSSHLSPCSSSKTTLVHTRRVYYTQIYVIKQLFSSSHLPATPLKKELWILGDVPSNRREEKIERKFERKEEKGKKLF